MSIREINVSEIIENHPNHQVIITTHAYLYRDGTTLDSGDVCPPSISGGTNNGDAIWDKLIKKHENIVLVLSGHDPCDSIILAQDKGENGNIFGYVQIWESDQSLSHYMKISKEYMSANVFGFREGTITMKDKKWHKWDYIVADTAVSQGFYEQNGKIYLCTLCVPYQEKTYAFDKVFTELLESVV